MIRPFTFVCMLLAGGSGLYLYQTKHRAQLLDREIGRTLKQTEVTRERIGMLRAEWALLNEPERLSELSRNHLGLRTLAPSQFAAMADLGTRLPAPVAPGTTFQPPGFEPEEAPAPVMAQAAPPPAKPAPRPTAMAALAPVPNPSAPAQSAPAQITPAASAPSRAAAAVAEARIPAPPHPAATRPPATPAPVPAPVQVAAAPHRAFMAPVMAVAATTTARVSQPANGATAPGTIGEAVLRAMQANAPSSPAIHAAPRYAAPAYVPAAAPAYAPPAYAQPSYAAPAYAASPYAQPASVLGGSRTALPPPVPYAAR